MRHKSTMFRPMFALLLAVLVIAACATPQDGSPGFAVVSPGERGTGTAQLAVRAADEWPESPCSMIDQIRYESSRELENAADVIVVGELTSIALEELSSGPTWVVHFQGESASGPASEQAMGGIVVHFPRVCGETPYGPTFAVGNRFILLLSGPHDAADFPDAGTSGQWFSIIQTEQGVVPIVDGTATPLPGSYVDGEPVTISRTTAASFGAPFPALETGEDFVAGDITQGIPDEVVPQFWNSNVGAAWSREPGVLLVMTAGSTGCPIYASAEAAPDDGDSFGDGVRIMLSPQRDPDEACLEEQSLIVNFVPDGNWRAGESRTILVQPRRKAGEYGLASWATPNIAHQILDADSLTVQAGGWAPGIPSGITAPPGNDALPGAAWTGVEGLLYVFTWGSSSCPTLAARDATVEHTRGPAGYRDAVIVELIEPSSGRPCTADLAPTTSIVKVPDGIDNNEAVNLTIGDYQMQLQPRGPEWDPAIGGIIGPAAWASDYRD
jgi:hypothetical protein